MDLGGEWRAALWNEDLGRVHSDPSLDDSGWEVVTVPGHWRSHPVFAGSDGPVLYRRHFESPTPEAGTRSFLSFAGIFYQGDVWLDGEYLGDTEGYFFPHTFEITKQLSDRPQHVLAVEVACPRPTDLTSKRSLTGIFQHWDCIDPAWNPGGIWAPVRIDHSGPVRIGSLKVLCPDANEDSATLAFEAELDSAGAATVVIRTTARREGDDAAAAYLEDEQTLAAGPNLVRWRLTVDRPALWWPHSLGAQPLHEIEVDVHVAGASTDSRRLVTGLRQVRIRNFIATVNGERIFLKGANCGPTRRALAEATADEPARDVSLARDAGLDLMRIHAHITRRELYEAADRQGMLIWQDLPLQWGYGQVRRQAVAQARRAVILLGHHPSVALWCGHNEPLSLDLAPGTALAPKTVVRLVAGQVLPTWNKTALDRSIRRALERADGSREVVAHSGILPHPAWGTDTHLYFGWYHGDERDLPGTLARFPVLARFVSEFGAQAVPEEAEFMNPQRWPELDWEDLQAHHALQPEIFEQRVPPGSHATFVGWRDATQAYQANLLRHHIETLRRLKYRPTGGFCMFLLADAQPAVSWSVLDHDRRPKAGYHAVAAACAAVIVTASRPEPDYRPGERMVLDLHAVSDLRSPLAGAVARAVIRWPGGENAWRFAGEVPADGCVRIGHLEQTFPAGSGPGAINVDLTLRWEGGQVTNSYQSHLGTAIGP